MTEAALPGTGPGDLVEMGEEDVDGVRLGVAANAPPSLRALEELSAVHGDAVYLVDEAGVAKGDRVALAVRAIRDEVDDRVATITIDREGVAAFLERREARCTGR